MIHPIVAGSAALVLCLGFPPGLRCEEGVVVIPPGESSEQLILRGYPDGTRFQARGLVLLGGMSERFRPPPRFCLFSDFDRDPDRGIGYQKTAVLEGWELPNAELYPIQLRDMRDVSISGFAVIGQQSRQLPWRVMKAMWDGDALHVKGCSGKIAVSDVYWENVEDGFGPDEGPESWSLKNAWMRAIRDDAIENDDLVPGEIVNCLIDGCFVFLSQRSPARKRSKAVTVIRDTLVRIAAQPHDGEPGKKWIDRNIQIGADGIGRAPGMIFKWGRGSGTVEVKNCVFRMDAVSVNGPGDMRFPPGDYENVTLVWLGKGKYPAPLPIGVTVTDDVTAWEAAKKAWIARAGKEHPGLGLRRSGAGSDQTRETRGPSKK